MAIFSTYKRLFNSVQQSRMIFPPFNSVHFYYQPMIPTSAPCNRIHRLAPGRSPEFQCGKPITPSFPLLQQIYVFVPYDSPVTFREQLCQFIRAIHIELNVPPLHSWWGFFYAKAICLSQRPRSNHIRCVCRASQTTGVYARWLLCFGYFEDPTRGNL